MQSDYRVKKLVTEEGGDVVAICYDVLYGETFEKYIGIPDDFDARENASNLLQDSNYEISDEIRAEIEETFGVSEFNDDQDYDSYQFYDFGDDEWEDDEDEIDELVYAGNGNGISTEDEEEFSVPTRLLKKESFNLREALNTIDLNTYNKYDLLNLYEACNLSENEKRALANIVYDQNDPSVIYDTLNDRFLGKEIEMPERVKDGVIHEDNNNRDKFLLSWLDKDTVVCQVGPTKTDEDGDEYYLEAELWLDYSDFDNQAVTNLIYENDTVQATDKDIESFGTTREELSKVMMDFANKDISESKSIKENVQSPLKTCLNAWKKLEQESSSYDEAIDLVTTAEQLVGYYIDRYEEEAYSTYLGNRGVLSNVTPEMDEEIISLFNQITEIKWVGEYLEESVKSPIKEDFYRGNKSVQFIGHGEWSDPELEYKGYLFNYWNIEDALWNDFLEETGYSDAQFDDPTVESQFNKFVQDRASDLLDDCIYGGSFTGLAVEGDMITFPNGDDYFYVGYNYKTEELSLDTAYNTGRTPEYSIKYDFSKSIDENLQALYDFAIEKSPWLSDDELDESTDDGYTSELTDNEKKLLMIAQDMGNWGDLILDDEENHKEYDRVEAKAKKICKEKGITFSELLDTIEDEGFNEDLETSTEWEHTDKDGRKGRIRQLDDKGNPKSLTRGQARKIADFRGHKNDDLNPIK
jgi:hypothetical protein